MAVDVRYMTLVFFEDTISVTVTSTPSVVRKWLRTTIHASRYHLHRLIVGLGVQWLPSRYSGDDPPAATLQLCVGRRCLIFQLLHSETVPNLLRRFLVHPNNIFVGLWNHSDEKKLEISKHRLVMLREPLDLRLHAVARRNDVNLQNQPRETIVREVLGYDVVFEEWINTSEWNAYELSDDQVSQACLDAYASFLIGKYIRAWEFCARDFNML